eukprot:456700_1
MLSWSCTLLQIYLIAPSLSQTCAEPYQCVGEQLSLSSGTIDITGYKAAIGASTSFSGTNWGRMYCEGAFSCQGMSSIVSDGSVYCKSTRACSNTSIQVADSDWAIYCHGLHTCLSSVLTVLHSMDFIRCDGVQSCAFSRINVMSVLAASGAHALYSATIHSSSDLTIELRGELSGYGATFTCHSGHTCRINCQAFDACYMFYIDCIGNCIINNPKKNIAPITNITHVHVDDVYNMTRSLTNTEHICNTHPNAITYDIFDEQHVDIENSGPICCRARGSCELTDITSQSTLICSGGFSCKQSSIHANNGSVFCEAADSCFDSGIYNASHLYCWATISCSESIITASKYVVCAGKQSCKDSIFYSDGHDLDVYFTGDRSGETAEIYCNQTDRCNIMCNGYNSCDGTTLVCDGMCNVSCGTSSLCPVGWTPNPTLSPTLPTGDPTLDPTTVPTIHPTIDPTIYPTIDPTIYPTIDPSIHPTIDPTIGPNLHPTCDPTIHPTIDPTVTSVTNSSNFDETKSDVDKKESELDLNLIIFVSIGSLLCIICVLAVAVWYFWKHTPESKSARTKPPMRIVSVSNVDTNDVAKVNNRNVNLAIANATKGETMTYNVGAVMKGSAVMTRKGDSDSDHENDDLYLEYPKQETNNGKGLETQKGE